MIALRTQDPEELLRVIYDAIDKSKAEINIEGRIITWGYDEHKYLHHNPDTSNDWAEKAWFEPRAYPEKNILLFLIKGPDHSIEHMVYGIYHGRFLEMMINHFPSYFTVHDITVHSYVDSIDDYINSI